MLSLDVVGGADTVGMREAWCGHMVTLVDLVLLVRATRKACSLFYAMHETMVVSTIRLFAGALCVVKLLDRIYQAASHMAVHVGRARRSHARHCYSTLSGRQYTG